MTTPTPPPGPAFDPAHPDWCPRDTGCVLPTGHEGDCDLTAALDPPPAGQHFPDGGGRVHAGSREGCWLCDPPAGGVGSGEPTPKPSVFYTSQQHAIYAALAAERTRAHAKHGDKSMESAAWDDMKRLRILVEEVGEIAKVFNELDLGVIDEAEARRQCYKETLQTAAMATAWAEETDHV